MTQTYLDARFPKAVSRYRRFVLVTTVLNLGIYFLTIKYSFLIIQAHQDAIVEVHGDAIVHFVNILGRQAAKILIVTILLVAALPVPILIQVLAVRFASRNPVLHCLHCQKFIADKDSIKAIRKYGSCPACEVDLIPEDEIGVERFEQERLPVLD